MNFQENLKISIQAGSNLPSSTYCSAGPGFLSSIPDSDSGGPHPLSSITDRELIKLCKKYGQSARGWMREFAFLLPEVQVRGLHRKTHASIQHFAAQLAGMSFSVCRQILALSQTLAGKPRLWATLRKHGWSKLRVIASVAKFEDEDYWIHQLDRCTKAVLAEFVKVYKINQIKKEKLSIIETGHQQTRSCLARRLPSDKIKSDAPLSDWQNFTHHKILKTQNGLCTGEIDPLINLGEKDPSQKIGQTKQEPLKNDEFGQSANLPVDNPDSISAGPTLKTEFANTADTMKSRTLTLMKFKIDPETEFLFRLYKQKLEKSHKSVMTMGEVLKELLQRATGKFGRKSADESGKKGGNESRRKSADESEKYGNESGRKSADESGKRAGRNVIPLLDQKHREISRYILLDQKHREISRYISRKNREKIFTANLHHCAMPHCNFPADEIHHPERFALTKNHQNLIPLCKKHHSLVHSSLIENEKDSPNLWKIKTNWQESDYQLQMLSLKSAVDESVRGHKGD